MSHRNTLDGILARGLRTETGCLEWLGRLWKGYGKVSWLDRDCAVHRLAWELQRGPIQDGLFVLHKCDNPKCYEVEHLYLGTHADNMRDMVTRGRSRTPVGEAMPTSKLRDCDVLEARALRAAGVPYRAIIARLGVSYSTLYRAVTGRGWKHVQPAAPA